MTNEPKALRLAGWAGIVFAILSLAIVPLALPPPPLGSTGAVFSAYFGAHRWAFLVGNYLGLAAFVPGFAQLAVFVGRLRRLEGPAGWLAPLVLATGTFTYAIFFCSLVVFQVLPFLASPRDDVAVGAFGTFANVWFALDGLAALPLVLAVGWATKETKALGGWMAPLSWVVAGLVVVMSFGSMSETPVWLTGGGPVSALGFVGFFAWTGVWGVAMLRVRPATDPAPATTAAGE